MRMKVADSQIKNLELYCVQRLAFLWHHAHVSSFGHTE